MDWRDFITARENGPRILADGCVACNASQVACTSSLSILEQPCCALCNGHEGLSA